MKFLKWRKVFGKVESERMLTRKAWDYAIDLKEMFKPWKGRIYPLSKDKKEKVQNFMEDQLRKRYIRLSKSPQTSPVFFVDKKDRSKWMVIDYCSLNDQTVENNYLLLLITELINNMGSKKVFTKMDLRWGFNNIRIKEEDEWKGAFTTHIGSFKPMVMFFRMTNLPATFQAMMNEILRDLINEGKVATFVDDVLVEKDNEDQKLVKPEWLEMRKMEIVEIIVDRVDLLEEVRKSKVRDDEVVKAMEEMKKAGVKMLRDEEWREADDVMYKEGKVYVLKDNKLRAEIIRLYHNTTVGGHGGQ